MTAPVCTSFLHTSTFKNIMKGKKRCYFSVTCKITNSLYLEIYLFMTGNFILKWEKMTCNLLMQFQQNQSIIKSKVVLR